MRILTIGNNENKKFLRKQTKRFTFSKKEGFSFDGKKISRKEINDLLQRMKKIMREAHGIGLSANQIGLSYRLFVAEVPGRDNQLKFYAVFNPDIKIIKGGEVLPLEEGCLSVPGVRGTVKRAYEVKLTGLDKNGKALKIRAWGILAHVFQHEADHLDGKLFLDKAEETYKINEKVESSE